jgi:hypothetical protein
MSKKITMERGINPQDVVDDINPSPAITLLRKDNQKLRARVDELKLALGEDEEYFESIKKTLMSIEPLPSVSYDPPEDGGVGSGLSAVMVFSDWHIGEYTDSDEVEGFNSFSWAIAQKRAFYLTRKFVNWVAVQRRAATINEAVIICDGDLISGDIHQELQVTNEWPVPVQNVKAAFLLAKCVSEIAPHFDKVRVEFMTTDNHSRRTKKPQSKQSGLNSEGYVIAYLMQERLRDIPNVQMNIYTRIKALVNIQGFPFLVEHGNSIRGWAGIPWYGADRSVAREAKARRMMPKKNFYKCLIGHFHQPMKTPDYIVNGSLSGTSEFDHGQGRHADPCQIAFLVHPKYGDFNFNELYVHFADELDFGGDELVHALGDDDAIEE